MGETTAAPRDESTRLNLALQELSVDAAVSLRAALEARVLLRSEIENVVSVRA